MVTLTKGIVLADTVDAVALDGLLWRLDARINRIEQRLAHIEGGNQGRFNEGPAVTP